MPRQSRAAIETAALCVDVRRTMPPKPPPELSDGQAAIGRDVVGPCRETGLHAAATRS